MSAPDGECPAIALLPWGDAIEDFLDPLGVALEDLRDHMSGGWLFGYVQALATVGVEAAVVCCSRAVRTPERWRHRPTGAPLLVLPMPRVARRLRACVAHPYAWSAADARRRAGLLGTLSAQPAHQLAPYLATPVRALAAEARRRRWRALVCQEYEYPRFDVCVALGRALRVPVLGTFQGAVGPRTGLERRVRPHTIRASAGLIVAAGGEAERVRSAYGVPDGRIARIPNPLDVDRWRAGNRSRARAALGLPASATVVAWHGRVDMRNKGLDVLLEAWSTLAERPGLPERRLLLVGSGVDDDALRARLPADAVWVDRYVFEEDQRAELLSAADAYAFPSRHEGFAVAPLEAMAAGLPVVAAAAPGVAELLPDGRDSGGLVVPVGDAVALANALAEVLSDPDLRLRLADRARRRAREGFGLQPVGGRLRNAILREAPAPDATP